MGAAEASAVPAMAVFNILRREMERFEVTRVF
jgi:hypothetical protein